MSVLCNCGFWIICFHLRFSWEKTRSEVNCCSGQALCGTVTAQWLLYGEAQVVLTKENWVFVLFLLQCLCDKNGFILKNWTFVQLQIKQQLKAPHAVFFFLMNELIAEHHVLHGEPAANCSFWFWQINSKHKQQQQLKINLANNIIASVVLVFSFPSLPHQTLIFWTAVVMVWLH